MARPLVWLLAPEGGSDSHFLRPLLRRCLEDACLRSHTEIEIPDGIDLRQLAGYSRGPVALQGLLAKQPGQWLLFVHADADGEAGLARRNHVDPIVARLASGTAGVPVVPVRETEAWILADTRLLARVFGSTTRSLVDLGLPRTVADIERHASPKQLLSELHSRTTPRRRRSDIPFERFGQSISLSALRSLPAFTQFEADLQSALHRLGILQP